MGCCLCCCSRERWRARKRVQYRVQQEEDEQESARSAVVKFCREEPVIKAKYSLALNGRPKTIGGRLQKYWFVLNERSSDAESELTVTTYDAQKKAILTLSPVSVRSPIKTFQRDKTIQTLNAIIHKVKKQPGILPVEGIWYIKDRNQLVTVQKFMERSLRDYLCREYPYNTDRKRKNLFLIDWSEKYRQAHILQQNQIASIGRQILEAMKFLYKSGFTVLGHIHSGNIFVEEDCVTGLLKCYLGGYDMLLQGYKTKLYRIISEAKLLHRIDMIMFGHVVFEMATGQSLEKAVPSQEDYQKVESEEIRRILSVIFDKEGTVKKLLKDEFFKRAQVQNESKKKDESEKVSLSFEEKALLKLTEEPYSLDQPVHEGKSFGERWRDFKNAFSHARRHGSETQPLLQDSKN